MKIQTVHRQSGGPVSPNPYWEERILYLQDNMRRQDSRRKNVNPLWPGGPSVTFYEARKALIERCNGDRKESFALDLDAKIFAPIEMAQKLTPEEVNAFRERLPRYETPREPTVRHKYVTTDTGERKGMFGYTARHVMTSYTVTPLTEVDGIGSETITDGWYIDLDIKLPCEIQHEMPKEGTWYAVAQLGGRTAGAEHRQRSVSASKQNLVERTYVGTPETGFGVQLTSVYRRNSITAGDQTEQIRRSESEVIELSTEPLDPALFEIPNDFRRVDQVLPGLRLQVWAQWLAWAHWKWAGLSRRA